MAPRCEVRIRFEGVSNATASQHAAELEQLLLAAAPNLIDIHRLRTSAHAQDLGSILVVVLGTPAALAVAKGIHTFIAKRGSKIVLETSSGILIATGDAATNIDAAATAAALTASTSWENRPRKD